MKCPYCAEEIKDEAIVCSYCGRDLTFYKPILEKLSFLEKRILEITNSLNDLQSISRPANENRLQKENSIFPILHPKLAVLLLSLVSIGNFLFYYLFNLEPFLFISMLSPLPFGLWLGATMPGKNFKTFVLLGFIIGVIISTGIFIIDSFYWGGFNYTIIIDIFLIYVIGAILLFTLGGFIGDWIERKRSPKLDKPRYFEGIAQSIGKGRSEKDIERLTNIINAFAPILTFAGVIIAAYLMSQANVPAFTPLATGTIMVDSSPTAHIYLDGNDQYFWTPYTIKDVQEGSHRITLKRTGYQDWSDTIDVKAGKTSTVTASLRPTTVEPILPGDEILHYLIVKRSKTNLTIEVIYKYNILHGKKVYVGASLLYDGKEIGTKYYPSQVPTIGNGTATVTLETFNNISIRRSSELDIFLFEENKKPFVRKYFPFEDTWEPSK